MRAEFRVWPDQGDLYHIMFDQATKQRYRVDSFPIANQLINQMMQAILPLLKAKDLTHLFFHNAYYLEIGENFIIIRLIYV